MLQGHGAQGIRSNVCICGLQENKGRVDGGKRQLCSCCQLKANYLYILLKNFILRTLFLQGFALLPTGCFKEFSCFIFGRTMKGLLPDA